MVGRQCDFRRRGARAHGVAMLEGIGQVQAQRRSGGGSIGNCERPRCTPKLELATARPRKLSRVGEHHLSRGRLSRASDRTTPREHSRSSA